VKLKQANACDQHETDRSEDDMNENSASRGPNRALLLVIPAAMIVAKMARRRRTMLESGWTPSAATGHGHGHRGRFGGEGAAAVGAFRLPPKIEWMLDTWHTRAHQKSDFADPETQTI
jgi:hypothetical protein